MQINANKHKQKQYSLDTYITTYLNLINPMCPPPTPPPPVPFFAYIPANRRALKKLTFLSYVFGKVQYTF